VADAILTQESSRAFRITLNRPEVRNAINLDALQQLIQALDASERSSAAVVVITGTGDAFCSGGDIQDMLARRGQAVATYERLRTGLLAIAEKVILHSKPVIARIDGDAVGAGCALAIACDVTLATKRSRFGFPFVKVGLGPDTGASWTLMRIAGYQGARRLLLTGDLVDAEEAHRLGLAGDVVADAAALDKTVEEWVQKFAALPPGALAATKRLLAHSHELPLRVALQQEALVQGVRFTTEEHAKAVDAFLSKKKA
jgi:enoyl-CoA hydratase/carnithine racemase